MQQIFLSEATAAQRRVPVHLVDATDGITTETGITGAGRVSKNGGATAASTNNIVEIDSTNMPGAYYLELTATEVNTLGIVVVRFKTAATAEFQTAIEVVALNPYDAVRAGLTALPNAAAEAAGGLYTRGSGAGQINQANNGNVDANVVRVGGTSQTAGDIMADTNDIQTRIPAALVGGRIDANVGAMGANVMTAAAAAADLTTELQANLATSAALTTAQADLTTLIGRLTALRAGYLDNLSAGAVATAATLAVVATYIDTEVASILTIANKLDTALELDGAVYRYTANAIEQAPSGGAALTLTQIVNGIWDEAMSSHLTVGTTGAKLNSAGGAGGSGSKVVNIDTTDNSSTPPGAPLQGVFVWASNQTTGSPQLASGTSNVNGRVTLLLNPGTYYIFRFLSGKNFNFGGNPYQTITVT